MIPSQPSNLFDQPFAQSGSKTIIPNVAGLPGRANLPAGFPTETQLPLSEGGVAPSRTDFNGILYMLSAFAFWQQSGGQWTYRQTLNYAPPSIVYYNNKLWWCLANNGPDATVAVPGAAGSERYWRDMLSALADMSTGGSGGGGGDSVIFGVPVGTIIMYHGVNAPGGYLPCNGGGFSVTTYPKLYAVLGRAATPDMRGLFVRGYDPAGVNDANGVGRGLGSRQGDAIRNITGTLGLLYAYSAEGQPQANTSGAFQVGTRGGTPVERSGDMYDWNFNFDASTQVPTAPENRPRNINLLYCIKHD